MFERKILDSAGANYPRKQFRRENWISLNGAWTFAFDDQKRAHRPEDVAAWPHTIQVPWAPECPASGIGDTGYHSRCWYRREFFISPQPGQRTLLHFGAVDYEAHVWVNGSYIGAHEGGYTPFTFDITESLREGDAQEIIVRVDDDPQDLTKPRGKQDWQLEPHSIWYPRTTGIWQAVWLENVGETHIDRLRCTPQIERWEIDCEIFINGPCTSRLQVAVKLKCGETVLAHDRYGVIHSEVHRRIALSDPGIDDFRNELLWSPEKPTLIDVELELWDGDRLLDRVLSYTALRSVSVQRGRFLLNGRPYYMRLVLDQGYWPETFLSPPSPQALRKDIELVKAAGFNGVRKHQKVEDPDFLYWCDVMGLLVWSEMPSAYRFTHESVERLVRQWSDVIDRDINHPCIVMWVPFNESWGVPDLSQKEPHRNCVQALYHLTKTLDPSRPCIGNDGWESTATDIIGIHDYDDQPARFEKKYGAHTNAESLTRFWPGGRMITLEGYNHKNQPVMLTEFGGIACLDPQHPQYEHAWGYSVCRTPDAFRRRFEELLGAVHRLDLFTGFCYTQFTDTFQEANGLFRADRSPKFTLNAMAWAVRGGRETRGELTSAPQPPPLNPEDSTV